MAKAIVSMRIMPESPETDMEALKTKVMAKVVEFAGPGDSKTTITPIAFGLKSLDIIFVVDEDKGTEPIERMLSEFEEVGSAEVTDVRRALG